MPRGSTGFVVASGGDLSEGYGHGGPGVCMGDGQTEDEGVPSQSGRGDALLRRMPSYLDLPDDRGVYIFLHVEYRGGKHIIFCPHPLGNYPANPF